MGGLGYLEVAEDLSYKGPIDKFIPEEKKSVLRELAGLGVGDTIFFMADTEARAAYYAGMIRTELGQKLDLLEKNAFRFCYVNDFPMYEKDPQTKKPAFTHNPFSMPQGGRKALDTMDPYDILAYQYDIVIWYATAWSCPPVRYAITIRIRCGGRLRSRGMMRRPCRQSLALCIRRFSTARRRMREWLPESIGC